MRVEEKTETKLSDEIVLGVRRAVAIHQQMLDSDPAPKTLSLVIKLRGSSVVDVIVRPEWRR